MDTNKDIHDLSLSIEAWSKILQDTGSTLYEKAFQDRGLAGLSLVKFRYFELIAREPGIAPAALASRMGVSRPTVAAVIAGFIRQGLVRKERWSDDGRMSRLFLTDAAQGIVEDRRSMYGLAARRAAAVLDNEELRSLARLMRKAVGQDGQAT
jgi:DNA-binding MarR family transcriptional regulator